MAYSLDHFTVLAKTECDSGWGICLQFTKMTMYQISVASRACSINMKSAQYRSQMEIMIQIKPVSCLYLLIEQQWLFLFGGLRWPLICFLPLGKQQSNNHRTEDFVSEVYFWSGSWTSKSLLSLRTDRNALHGASKNTLSWLYSE